ncbi:hypothetical protein [Bradyrhizobium tropiciagri]|nr:hypothetical protein [Bradyrhizobium tropiciagri]
MLATDGALLIALATVLVSLDAVWTSLTIGVVGVWLILHFA